MVLRKNVGTYTDGYYTSGASFSFTIEACVQPPKTGTAGRILQIPAEGQRGDEDRVLYTTAQLNTRMPDTDPDVVIVDSERWEVFKVERWQAFGGTHYKVTMSRLQSASDTGLSETLDSLSVSSTGTV
jgi:hypothetical protein